MEDKKMNLIRWNNPVALSEILEDIERGFSFPFRNSNSVPATNIRENEKKINLELAVPGMKKEDFKIKVDGNLLSISAEKKIENEEENEKFARKEFYYGTFCRSFSLPKSVEIDEISANYEDGILKIEISKKEEATKFSKEVVVS